MTTGTSSGKYLYIDVVGEEDYSKARIISPVMMKTTGSCAHFYYHAYGSCFFLNSLK